MLFNKLHHLALNGSKFSMKAEAPETKKKKHPR